MSLQAPELDILVSATAKEFGAFYTDAAVADFLVSWGTRQSSDKILDPSFGGGAFLHAAVRHIERLGGNPARSVYGVEIDSRAHNPVAVQLKSDGIPSHNLLVSDFFDVDPADKLPLMDVVVGNPPFIRYQRFSGDTRFRALERAKAQRVALSELASSWAPFVVHSVAMLKRGGRLGMVAPAELGHAGYALPVIRFLRENFGRVTFLTFDQKLFPQLSEDTLLILADGKGYEPSGIFTHNLHDASSLKWATHKFIGRASRVDEHQISSGATRLIEYLLPKQSRRLLENAATMPDVVKLGSVVDVGIGYVTGANDFFHLAPDAADKWKIPEEFLRPAVRRGRSLRGTSFTHKDWQKGLADGESGYLLYLTKEAAVDKNVRRYIEDGEKQGIHEAYKCRVRSPWYCVPHVYQPDAFLTYMSGTGSRFVVNTARAVAPNSLHVVRLLEGRPRKFLKTLAISWHTSLTRLSAEITGHPLGGGMLKLEPTEAERVAVAVPNIPASQLDTALRHLDSLVRCGNDQAATTFADKLVLQDCLGFSEQQCAVLHDSARVLLQRRTGRSNLESR